MLQEKIFTESSQEVYSERVELEVTCNAMEEAGIKYGDRVTVRRSSHCRNGQIIIALLNGQFLIREYQCTGLNIMLIPASKKLAAIEVDTRGCDFKVWGVVEYGKRNTENGIEIQNTKYEIQNF